MTHQRDFPASVCRSVSANAIAFVSIVANKCVDSKQISFHIQLKYRPAEKWHKINENSIKFKVNVVRTWTTSGRNQIENFVAFSQWFFDSKIKCKILWLCMCSVLCLFERFWSLVYPELHLLEMNSRPKERKFQMNTFWRERRKVTIVPLSQQIESDKCVSINYSMYTSCLCHNKINWHSWLDKSNVKKSADSLSQLSTVKFTM